MRGGEYFKLADLMGHYITHQNSNASYNGFFSFLNDHYFRKGHHEKEHKNLPFKNHSIQTVTIACSVPQPEFLQLKVVSENSHKQEFFYSNEFVSQEWEAVWNPPRVC